MQAYGPEELLDSSNIRKLIKVGTDVTAIATDAVTLLQYALVRHRLGPGTGNLPLHGLRHQNDSDWIRCLWNVPDSGMTRELPRNRVPWL